LPVIKDLIGQTFNRLTVKSLYPVGDRYGRYWICQCTCGNEIAVRSNNLTSGHTKSCGCLHIEQARRYFLSKRIERNKKHGS